MNLLPLGRVDLTHPLQLGLILPLHLITCRNRIMCRQPNEASCDPPALTRFSGGGKPDPQTGQLEFVSMPSSAFPLRFEFHGRKLGSSAQDTLSQLCFCGIVLIQGASSKKTLNKSALNNLNRFFSFLH